MNELLNPTMTPPGLYRYRIEGITNPEVALVKGYYGYNDLEAEVIKRLKSNHLPVPPDLRQKIIDQLCANLPKGWCSDGSGGAVGLGWTHEFARVVQGTATLFDWFVSAGREKVPIEEATRRASICVGCIFNATPAGCSSCNRGALATAANKIVNGTPTKFDSQLQACSICSCQLTAKIHLPIEVLRRHLTAGQLAQLPPKHSGFVGCWLREETV